MDIVECRSDEQIASTFAVMHQLRGHLVATEYISLVREIEDQGGRLIGAFGEEKCVGCALFRRETRLFTGPLIYIDDLVTDKAMRSGGIGAALLGWIEEHAKQHSIQTIALDSAVHRGMTHKFYFRNGFTITSFNFKKPLT
jgi:GNAT superfamily N-acetyltransferase